jgi:hypothetical protein
VHCHHHITDITNEVEYQTSTLTLTDAGDYTAQGKVQAQYPNFAVKIFKR